MESGCCATPDINSQIRSNPRVPIPTPELPFQSGATKAGDSRSQSSILSPHALPSGPMSRVAILLLCRSEGAGCLSHSIRWGPQNQQLVVCGLPVSENAMLACIAWADTMGDCYGGLCPFPLGRSSIRGPLYNGVMPSLLYLLPYNNVMPYILPNMPNNRPSLG
jgi:hypothetical protein